MKISEVTVQDVVRYCKLEEGEYNARDIVATMEAAKVYISGRTGIPTHGYHENIDDFDDFYYPFMVICREIYDTRTMTPDSQFSKSSNKIVENILDMHARHLVR